MNYGQILEAAKVLAVIPARYASSRFPGKPLAPIAGQAHDSARCGASAASEARFPGHRCHRDARIKSAVEAFGGEAILTRSDHRTGTDRVAEVAVHVPAEIYVNVQGDEPLIDPGTVDALVSAMLEDDAVQLATPCTAISQPSDIMDPNVVKVVRDFDGNGLYFSRAPIPWVRDTGRNRRGAPLEASRLVRLPPRGAARVSHASARRARAPRAARTASLARKWIPHSRRRDGLRCRQRGCSLGCRARRKAAARARAVGVSASATRINFSSLK